ncbi:hypothetical protein [Paenibacillus hexagrammi]|uniref:Transposase n=1 Tax=Paenibacillus hexagrammi TaxID=2908839 RepID=A0ABY3SEN8_9BACL|nr:hypothetical protein [Paenibacillus sp. YPD9-1]UJF31651.1 hypothetical protein L0M14_17890 [Paenibacillus sp. YPD9-1]
MNVKNVGIKQPLHPAPLWKEPNEIVQMAHSSLLVAQPEGINATTLAEIIQVTYKTAWAILQKIRLAMHETDEHSLLSGKIRANSAIYGKPYNSSIRKHPQEHLFTIAASQDSINYSQQIKLKIIPTAHLQQGLILKNEIEDFKSKHIATYSDDVQYVTGRYSPERFHDLLQIANQACKWLNNTYHGLGKKYLQLYMDEFSYRYNHYLNNSKSMLLQLTQLCLSKLRLNYSFIEAI